MQQNTYQSETIRDYRESIAISQGCVNPETQFHSIRVALLAEELGHACNLSRDNMLKLKIAAYLHDIGKTSIPEHILNKPANLDDREWVVVRRHSEYGQKLVSRLNTPYCKEASYYVRHHHERWDGNGYPDRLSRQSIPIISSIISLVDSYDAITELKPYRNKFSHDQAVKIMENEIGAKFDPYISKLFFSVIDNYHREI